MKHRSSLSTDKLRLVRCTVPGIRVEIGEHGHLFQVGDVVDLEAPAAPGLTWRDALGAHADAFVAADENAGPAVVTEPPQE